MSTSRYRLSIISKSPQTLDRPLLPYEVGGEQVIGAFGDERYALRFENHTSAMVQVRLSIDGTDIMTGAPATTDPTGSMWVVNAYGAMELEAWPEGQRGGGRFVFTHVASGVAANTHGVVSDVGVIAAAVFTEGAPPLPVRTRGILRGGGYGQSRGAETMSFSADRGGPLESIGGADDAFRDMTRSASTGVGEYVEQHLVNVAGLRQPVLASRGGVVRLRYMWWDDLVVQLRASGVQPPRNVGSPGFPGDSLVDGINLSGVPRQGAQYQPPAPTFRRVG